MKKLAFATACTAACLGLAGCGGPGRDTAARNNLSVAGEGSATPTAESNGMDNAMASESGFPEGARIIEENGVTYRIDADGTRVRLGEKDARIVVENGVRYRVDAGGRRVRIDERGLGIDSPDIDLPDVDAGINNKGHPDVDVKDRDDGNKGPN
ncbi:MAG: hypothetical protein QOJ27_888 [Sphingomonadales bacterium]|nr:hypothetical protein [Sphingomonadales bacterium]